MSNNGPYIFGDPALDSQRLQIQEELTIAGLRRNAYNLVGRNIKSILDIGAASGKLGFALQDLYPGTTLLGIDRDAQAIAQAQAEAQRQDRSAEFVVGDVLAELPAGPFDLVFASTIAVHLSMPAKLVAAAYQVLHPGGWLWVRDLHRNLAETNYHPSFNRLMYLFLDTLAKLGASPYVMDTMPQMMSDAGFTAVRSEREVGEIGGSTPVGVAALGVAIGAAYNARHLIAAKQDMMARDIEQLVVDVANYSAGSPTPKAAEVYFAVAVGRKPSA